MYRIVFIKITKALSLYFIIYVPEKLWHVNMLQLVTQAMRESIQERRRIIPKMVIGRPLLVMQSKHSTIPDKQK